MHQQTPYFVEENITIAADLDVVWNIMIDWDAYPQWNPFIVKVQRQQRPSQPDRMLFDLKWPDGRTGRSREKMVSQGKTGTDSAELVYQYDSILAKTGLLPATRTQRITQVGALVEYHTREEFSGILARFVPFADVRQGFIAQAQALASHAEARSGGKGNSAP